MSSTNLIEISKKKVSTWFTGGPISNATTLKTKLSKLVHNDLSLIWIRLLIEVCKLNATYNYPPVAFVPDLHIWRVATLLPSAKKRSKHKVHVLFLIASRSHYFNHSRRRRGAAHAPAPSPKCAVQNHVQCTLAICFQVPTKANNYSLSLATMMTTHSRSHNGQGFPCSPVTVPSWFRTGQGSAKFWRSGAIQNCFLFFVKKLSNSTRSVSSAFPKLYFFYIFFTKFIKNNTNF